MAEKKILIVDNDPASLEDMARMVGSPRLQVVRACDGQAGYEAFQSEKPDLVVLEALLPKMHGFDLTKKISLESQGRVPVIIVTGLYRGPQYRHEALSSFGAADYFEKPLDAERFKAVVRQLVHDEEDIDEDLPDSNSILESLSRWIRGKHGLAKKAPAAGKGPDE